MLSEKDFEILYKIYSGSIYNFFYFSILNHTEAEDLTSITFLKLYINLDYYDSSKALPSTYLYKIARNTLNDYLRTNIKKKDISLDEIQSDILSEENIDDKIFLYEILSKLTERERQLIFYKYKMELSVREISELMNISVTNVTTLCSRTLKKIKKENNFSDM